MGAAAERPRGGRLYAALLHLYPASFRLEYGAEMRADFARRRTRTSGAGALVLWLDTLIDVVHNATRVHLDVLRQDLRFTLRTLGKRDGWLVSRYADVLSVLKDPRLAKDPRSASGTAKEPWVPGFLKPLQRNMLDLDPPDHTRLRGLVHKAFTPRLVEQ